MRNLSRNFTRFMQSQSQSQTQLKGKPSPLQYKQADHSAQNAIDVGRPLMSATLRSCRPLFNRCACFHTRRAANTQFTNAAFIAEPESSGMARPRPGVKMQAEKVGDDALLLPWRYNIVIINFVLRTILTRALVSGSGPPNFRSIRLGPNPNPNPNPNSRRSPNPNPNPNPTGSWVGPNSTQVP